MRFPQQPHNPMGDKYSQITQRIVSNFLMFQLLFITIVETIQFELLKSNRDRLEATLKNLPLWSNLHVGGDTFFGIVLSWFEAIWVNLNHFELFFAGVFITKSIFVSNLIKLFYTNNIFICFLFYEEILERIYKFNSFERFSKQTWFTGLCLL